MDPAIARILDAFETIDLAALNRRAAMLTRLDCKYVIPAERLRPALEAFRPLFDILEIDGRRSFAYATSYFDDDARSAYHDHHQGRRKRYKVRVRSYLDAGLDYLEVKLKDRREVTVKRRLPLPGPVDTLDATCTAFIDRCHAALYGRPLGRQLQPVLAMTYRRITLVAKAGGERMTIDTGMEFTANGRHRRVAPEMFIVETKSARGNGAADAILRGLHLRPTKRCSKYCIGMAATGQISRANRFLPALRRLHLERPSGPMAGPVAGPAADRRPAPPAAHRPPARPARRPIAALL